MNHSKRTLIAAAGATTLALLVASCSSSSTNNSNGSSMMGGSGGMGSHSTTTTAPATAASTTNGTLADEFSSDGRLAVTLTAAETLIPYGSDTRWAMTYNGSAAGPTLHVHPGDQLAITLVNNLKEATSLHTHGLHVSPSQDNPFLMVDPGKSRTYTYDIPTDQQAGTFWYHPHVHMMSAEQVASGLSGAILVEDDTDKALAASTVDQVLVINDPPLVQSNPWTDRQSGDTPSAHQSDSSMGGMDGMGDMGGMSGSGSGDSMGMGASGVDMMTAMSGRIGPRLLTNGQDGVSLAADGSKLQRVNIVNATASTRLSFDYDGAQMLRLAATGGRLPQSESVTSLVLAPGERTELILIPNASGGRLKASRLSNEHLSGATGIAETIATVSKDAGTDISQLPASLTANTRDLFASEVKPARTRVVTLDGHMNPVIDGVPFDPNKVNLTASKGTVEEWVIKSHSPMVHPIHLHTWPFQVKGQAGWTDIVTVPPFGEVTIRVAFDDFGGTTVLHCHILDHEDNGMMSIIKVA